MTTDQDMPTLPTGATMYKSTPVFDDNTVPDGLLREHRTKAGTWGRIVVLQGELVYEAMEPDQARWVLNPRVPGIIEPEMAHRIVLSGPVRFQVEFHWLPKK